MHGHARSRALDSHARFTLGERLGEGAHGEVFEAFDRLRGTRVAIKTLRHTSPQNILRFKREFRALAQLRHPNVVELGELFEHEGRWFFTMELVEGRDFMRYVRGRADDESDETLTQPTASLGGCDVERLRAALVQLGRGLDALHRAGKIHRDVKPSNIRIRRDGRLVLLDFGLVTEARVDESSLPEQVVGTVGYMAPEQAAATGPLSSAADCYAVGVLIYEALTGELPFTGPALDVLRAKRSRPVSIPQETAATAPAGLVELCHALCRLDPAQRPSARALIARASGLRARPAATFAAHHESRAEPVGAWCLGRERELSQLDRAFARSRASLGSVHIHGASGIGKTALLRAFRLRLAHHDAACVVLSGSCDEQERVTYRAFDAAIDELGRQLERLDPDERARIVPKYVGALAAVFPVLGGLAVGAGGARALPSDPVTLRLHAHAALRDLLQRLAERVPVVLILDALQWADAESLELLSALVRPPDPPPLLLITAMWRLAECTPELRERIARMFSNTPGLEIELGTLPLSAAELLARRLVGGASLARARRLAEAASCHPLFIEVLARATQRSQREVRTLEHALGLEISALSEHAQRVLRLVCVAGTAIAERTLAEAAGLAPEPFARALTELRHARFARAHEHAGEFSVRPYHVEIGAALLEQLDAAGHQQQHLLLAQALARSTSRDEGVLALHWLRAGRGAEAAAAFARAAASAEQAGAYGQAAGLYRSALEASPDTSAEDRSRWLQGLATAYAHAGRSADAAATFVAAADGCEPAQSRQRLLSAAEQFLRDGDSVRGLAIARPFLRELGENLADSTPALLAGLLWRRACVKRRGSDVRARAAPEDGASERERQACDLLWSLCVPMTSLDLVRGLDLHSRCLLRALRLGEPARMARSLALEGLYMSARTPDDEWRARGLLATADDLAQRSSEPYLRAFSGLCHSWFHLLVGEPALALATADAAAAMFEDACRNVAWEIGAARATALGALTYLGRFRELQRRFDSATQDAEARGNMHAFTTLVTLHRCTIDLVADRVDACRADLERVMRESPAQWHLQQAFAVGAHVLLDLYAGGDAAHHRLEAEWGRSRHRLISNNDRIRIFFVYVRGLAALSALLTDPRDARARMRLVRRCAAQLARERAVDAISGGHMLRGQLAVLRGERAAAIAEYRSAAELWGRVGMYGSEIAKLRLGELIGGDEGARLIAGCMAWAAEQGIRRPGQFFRTCAPVTFARAAESS